MNIDARNWGSFDRRKDSWWGRRKESFCTSCLRLSKVFTLTSMSDLCGWQNMIGSRFTSRRSAEICRQDNDLQRQCLSLSWLGNVLEKRWITLQSPSKTKPSTQVSQQGQRTYQGYIWSNPSRCSPPLNKSNFSPRGQREHTAQWTLSRAYCSSLPLPKVYPTLKEAVDKLKEVTTKRNSEDEQRRRKKAQKDHKRATYFVMGRSTNFWTTPVCGMIKKLVHKHDMKWLRFKMANSRFTNLAELLEGDLSKKVMAGIVDENMVDQPCNCNVKSLRENGSCLYGGNCRKEGIYALSNKNTDQTYYGKTVQHLKERTRQHFTDVWKIIDYNLHPDN